MALSAFSGRGGGSHSSSLKNVENPKNPKNPKISRKSEKSENIRYSIHLTTLWSKNPPLGEKSENPKNSKIWKFFFRFLIASVSFFGDFWGNLEIFLANWKKIEKIEKLKSHGWYQKSKKLKNLFDLSTFHLMNIPILKMHSVQKPKKIFFFRNFRKY